MPKLVISTSLSLPVEYITYTTAVLGNRGSGKTTTAKVLAEEMLSQEQQVCWIDPLDVAWGLRSTRDGKSAGYRIIVMGGEHGDLPLESTAGSIVAEFVVSTGASVILALRHLSMSDQRRFATEFFERVYTLKGQSGNRTPLHMVLDECDEFVPQRIQHGHERLFGAVDRIVRRGRSSGLGVTLISQRPAVVNKDVLSMCETLICHRTISPQDRKALEAWISAHDVHGQREAFLSSLASLDRGEAWVWSPGWLNVFERVNVRAPHTFDSSSTPKAGEKPIAPQTLAKVDLDQLRQRMADTIEKAKAEDPRELRRRIQDLEKELAAARQANPGDVAAAEARGHQRGLVDGLTLGRDLIDARIADIPGIAPNAKNLPASAATRANGYARFAPPPAKEVALPLGSEGQKKSEIAGGLRRMLIALAQRSPLTRRQLGLRAQLSSRSGTFDTYLSRARKEGWVEGRDTLSITPAGIAAAGDFSPLPAGQELLRYWMGEVPDGAKRMLAALADAFPSALGRSDLGDRAGLSARSGTFDTYLSKLRTLELVEGRDQIRLAEELA